MIPIIKPTLPSMDIVADDIKDVLSSGMITNHKYVKKFEEMAKEYLEVKHAIAMNSATAGLMLCSKLLGLSGEVITPSFTFVATTNSLVWNGLTPVFVDCDRETLNIDTNKIEEAITPKTSAIMPVNLFGNPCDMDEIERIANKHSLVVIYDSAHAFGSKYKDKRVGNFGDAEVFCLSPTKVVTSCEGGLVTTDDDYLASALIGGRDYGNFGNYDCKFVGLSARMSELNAIIGIRSLMLAEVNIEWRNYFVDFFKKMMKNVKGIRYQKVYDDCRSVYQVFPLIIDEEEFGMSAQQLSDELKKEGIGTKTTYFNPPVHEQFAYKKTNTPHSLKVTEEISKNIICIPLYSHMSETEMIIVSDTIQKII